MSLSDKSQVQFTQSQIQSPSGSTLALYTLEAATSPKGVIHINHGLAEHSSRYLRFARSLASAGFTCVAHDHRGHGQTTAPDSHQGSFAASDGWKKVLQDVDAVNNYIHHNWSDVPVIYFGHSMGGIIGLNYIQQHSSKVDAAALWNFGVDGGPMLWLYKLLLAIERMRMGSDVPSAIAPKLTFETWNRKFAPNRTAFDWLSADSVEVDKYVADPLCGFDATNGLWTDLTKGIGLGGDNLALSQIRKDLPFHLIGGDQDPCTDFGEAVHRVAERLQKAGIQNVTCAVLPKTRHESLNEINRDETTKGFTSWLVDRFG